MQVKSLIAIAVAALCICPASAQRKTKKAKKNTKVTAVATTKQQELKPVDGNTFSYALGIAQGQSLKQFLIQREGVDSAYVGYAMQAMSGTMTDDERKKIIAQAAGLRIADINKRNLPAMNKQACGNKDSTYVNEKEFERGLTETVLGQASTIKPDSAMKIVEGQVKYQQETFKKANENWLTENAKLQGVKTLPSGLQYRVLTEGNGPVATDSTDVEVHYEGSLIDGTVFDSSYKRGKPATFKPSQVIKGWKEALTMMPEGSVWNLYIPASLGYGERGQGQQIPGNATLIFKVEVIKVKNTAATEAKK